MLELDDDDDNDSFVPVPVSPVLLVSNDPNALSRFNPPDVPEHPQPPLSVEEEVENGPFSSAFLHDSESVDEEGILVSAFPNPCG